MFNLIDDEIKKCGQTVKNCAGFASDDASNIVGCNNSLWPRLRNASPSCIKLKCTCHSLALWIRHALDKLPSIVGYILTEMPNWFRNSELRGEAYKGLFLTIHTVPDSQPTRTALLLLEKVSFTLWLVRGKILFNILMNWEELKAYFSCVNYKNCIVGAKYKVKQ